MPLQTYSQNGTFPFKFLDDITVRELESLASPVGDLILLVREVEPKLQAMANFIRRTDAAKVNDHRRVVSGYLTNAVEELAHLRQAVQSHNLRQISGAVENAIQRIDSQASRVDEATMQLDSVF